MTLIDITPDKSLLPKLGFAGYTAPQAIAELVDNSLDAIIENKKIDIHIKISPEEISISDTGCGMTKDEISKAFITALSNKKGKLGEFGLGLKTSCLSLGKEFELISKSANENIEYRIKFSEEEWKEANDGWKINLHERNADNSKSYTIVVIRKLKIFYPALGNYIKEDIQKRFSPFIYSNQATIKVNKTECKPEETNIIPESKKEFKIETESGFFIRGWYALLKEGSNKGYYGFHTYRRNRMITTYDKIAIGEHPTISRIIGEIHLDHVNVTHNKREFIKVSKEYQEAEKLLKIEFKDLLRAARTKASEETVTKDVKRGVDIWKEKIAQVINSNDFKNYSTRFKGLSEVIADKSGNEIDKVRIEKRDKNSDPEKNRNKDKNPESNNTRTPQKTHLKEHTVIRIKGKNIEFTHDFSALGVKESWKKYKYEKNKKIEIFTNTDFPSFMVTKDKTFYAVIHIAEAIAEVLINEANEDFSNVNDIKELILRKSSELKEQFVEEV